MMSLPILEPCDNGEDRTDWYKKFHDYDFDGDKSFQQGLQKVKEIPSFTEADYLKAKIFYFSRSVHPVNVTDYTSWLQKHEGDASSVKCSEEQSANKKAVPNEQKPSVEVEAITSSNSQRETDKQDNKTEKVIKSDYCSDITKGDKSTDLSDNLEKILTLADVAELIEKGVPLPGIKDLNIMPLEIDPLPSCLQRKNKPWEK